MLVTYQHVPWSLLAARQLQQMARRGAAAPEVVRFAARLWAASVVARILAAWKALPTHYVAEPDGVDDWQEAVRTLTMRSGDCEDWSVLLVAILLALGVNARIAVMPGHAAVVIPVMPLQYGWNPFGGWGPIVPLGAELMPATWHWFDYQGERWLPLESTTDPNTRGVPGEQTAKILTSARTHTLYIADQ